MGTPPPYSDNYLQDVKPPPGYFDRFRVGNFPTLYPSLLTSVTADILEAGWIFAACILAFSLLLVVPGVRRWHRRLSAFIRIIVAVGFWVFIILCNFGQDWEIADVKGVKTQYKALLPGEINATIGVHIGLRSVNITLLGEPRVQQFEHGLMNETIDYNERFSWDNRGWTLGRAGFGPYAGRFNQEFRAGQRRGLPYPILWIAEYFTVDGEGLRWGRFYLQAGYFTHIFLWTAWALWMLTIILFNMVPRYGGYFSVLTGTCLIIGNIIYGTLRNANQLAIPYYYDGCTNQSDSADNRNCVIRFHYAWCFWLCLATGICCFVLGVIVVIMDLRIPERLSEFFNVDITQEYEEFIIADGEPDAEEKKRLARHKTIMVSQSRPLPGSTPASPPVPGTSQGVDDIEMASNPHDPVTVSTSQTGRHGFRKRTIIGFGAVQKSHKTASRPESIYPPGQQPQQQQQQHRLPPPPQPHGSNMPVSHSRNGATNAAADTDDSPPASPQYVNIQAEKRFNQS